MIVLDSPQRRRPPQGAQTVDPLDNWRVCGEHSFRLRTDINLVVTAIDACSGSRPAVLYSKTTEL
jgi:hypothetical protein